MTEKKTKNTGSPWSQTGGWLAVDC